MAAGDGLVSMKPTSIAHSGTSASINADGGVDFTAVTSLSLNGVFTSEMDNYLVVVRFMASGSLMVHYRLRVGGSDDATANSYVRQQLVASGGTVGAGRTTADKGNTGYGYATQRAGFSLHTYGPFLAQPTATRSVTVDDNSSAGIEDSATTHNQSTSYDGITFIPSTGNITGNVHVFGYEE